MLQYSSQHPPLGFNGMSGYYYSDPNIGMGDGNQENELGIYYPSRSSAPARGSSYYATSSTPQYSYPSMPPTSVSYSYYPAPVVPSNDTPSLTPFWAATSSPTPGSSLSYGAPVQPTGSYSLSAQQMGSSHGAVASSSTSYTDDQTSAGGSRGVSPSAPDLRAFGYQNNDGTWTCAYPGCTSKAVFTRGCDLRKHHKRHTKSFFCRHEGCPQSTGGGFSSKKDLARHEAKHNPGIVCDWEGCNRLFSRVDNMRDHVKRIHLKGARTEDARSSR